MPRARQKTNADASWVSVRNSSGGADSSTSSEDVVQPVPRHRNAKPIELVMPSIREPVRSSTSQRHPAQRKHVHKTTRPNATTRPLSAIARSEIWLFAYSVLALTWSVMKPALVVLTTIWVVFYSFGLLTSTFTKTLSPICSLPGTGYLGLPFCPLRSTETRPVEFEGLVDVQSSFEDVLQDASGGINLPLEIKRSESSIRDLKHVVKFSTLPSRNELVFEFEGFIETARQAAADLTKFHSRIGRAVDHVINTNRWTLQVIHGVAERENSRGPVAKFVSETVLFPFKRTPVAERLLFQQYLLHTAAVEEQISHLILEAHTLLGVLQNLDDRLDVIHGITTRDGMLVKGSRDELFAQLWTKLGGNRSSKQKHAAALHLLSQVGNYRKLAFSHVTDTILKLQSISAGLEDLRERVAMPETLGKRDSIPLKLHIDNIQMAVDRLEEQRTNARHLEIEHQRRTLDGDNGGRLLLS